MTFQRDIYLTGIAMFVLAYVALWATILQLAHGGGNPYVSGGIGLLVGISGFVVGDIRRKRHV